MQTRFSLQQLADAGTAEAERIIRNCVHCGFCTATCPTYVTLGNELDSPRGRIYLIKDMLENGRAADRDTVTHIDRCLSCLSCMTTCPSEVDYMHLIDHTRGYIEKTYRRPFPDRMIRRMLAAVLPYPARFRHALRLARLLRPFSGLFARMNSTRPLAAMLELAPGSAPRAGHFPSPVLSPKTGPSGKVVILSGCAQQVLDPAINEATSELLARFGIQPVPAEGETCCGALVHHLGYENRSLDFARRNVDAWCRILDAGELDAIIVTASGCGTTVKDYGHMLRFDPDYSERAATVSRLAMDVTEYLARLDLPEPVGKASLVVAYHSACSLQHGQRVTSLPRQLLQKAGFLVRDPAEGHLCCGSAGTYNLLQPEIANRLAERKARNLQRTGADVVAAGNIGCITQLAARSSLPVVHTVQLLNWAWGGKPPAGLPD